LAISPSQAFDGVALTSAGLLRLFAVNTHDEMACQDVTSVEIRIQLRPIA
jgi:hypothetical protein